MEIRDSIEVGVDIDEENAKKCGGSCEFVDSDGYCWLYGEWTEGHTRIERCTRDFEAE